MVIVISRFRVRNGLEEDVRRAFLARPRLVENANGFRGLEVFTQADDPSAFVLLTRWDSEDDFYTWHRSEAHNLSHAGMPRGLKLDPAFTELIVGDRIEDANMPATLNDALEAQTKLLCQWISAADAALAVMLAMDGTIRLANGAAARLFQAGQGSDAGNIFDYLVSSDAEALRRRLAQAEQRTRGPFLLNVANGNEDPITLEACLIDCRGGALLLGWFEQRHLRRLPAELMSLTQDMASTTRELARKNRELAAANSKIADLARTDSLTGLMNRYAFDDALATEIARAVRLRHSLALIMSDVDHFKSINDRHGHLAGDSLLTAVGAMFRRNLRAYDVGARFGGDEFVALMPGTDRHQAGAIAERLRTQVHALRLDELPGRHSMTFGVALWSAGETAQHFLARADAALYRAKQAGKDRVEIDTTERLQEDSDHVARTD